MKKIDPLTSTRFFAAMLFLLYHIRASEIPIIKPLTELTPYMISFFFVLSGFVMTLVYYQPGKHFHYRDFWIARVSRIYPIHLLSFAIACIHYADALSKIKSLEYISSLLLFQAWIPEYALTFNFPVWTLAVEMFFYLLFPFLIWFAARQPFRRMLGLSLAFWTVNQIFRQVLIHSGMDVPVNFIAYFPALHLDAFLLGLVGGLWFLTEGRKAEVTQKVNLVFMLVSLSVIVFFVAVFNIGDRLGAINGFFSPLFVLIILTLSFDQTSVSRFLSQKWLVTLGESSYSLYAFHIPVLWLFNDVLLRFGIVISPLALLVTYVPIMVALSVAIFRTVEWPAQKWLRSHPQKLLIVIVDLLLIAGAFALAFVARIGLNVEPFARSIRFAVRTGVPLAFALLVLFRFYAPLKNSIQRWALSALLPLGIATGLLAAAMFLAAQQGWIDSFPRTFLPIGFALAFGFLFLFRFALQRWKPAWVVE
ncbi:MAG: acyltransferase family protein [Chloroflexota bacterium]